MYVHDMGSGVADGADVSARVDNHKVDVNHFVRELTDGFNNRETERDVGHEDAVHDVAVNPLRVAFLKHPDVASEIGEIRREYGGGDYHFFFLNACHTM